jgi:hypothetical protein
LELHPGRILGIILGLIILVTIFLVPFGSADTSTLYGKVGPWISNLGTIQSSYTSADLTYAYIFIAAFILLVIAGLVGLFPLGTGVLGVVGMAIITVAPYVVYPNGPTHLDPGAGFYVIWVASIASLGASFWHRKKQPANVTVAQTQTMGSATEATKQVKCPNCGTMNPGDSVQCTNCGTQLTKQP